MGRTWAARRCSVQGGRPPSTAPALRSWEQHLLRCASPAVPLLFHCLALHLHIILCCCLTAWPLAQFFPGDMAADVDAACAGLSQLSATVSAFAHHVDASWLSSSQCFMQATQHSEASESRGAAGGGRGCAANAVPPDINLGAGDKEAGGREAGGDTGNDGGGGSDAAAQKRQLWQWRASWTALIASAGCEPFVTDQHVRQMAALATSQAPRLHPASHYTRSTAICRYVPVA
jgi:hypothetical protein